MAKYRVNYRCGHEDVISLYGKIDDRYKKIEWLEKTSLCKECYQAELNKTNATDMQEVKMHYGKYKNEYADYKTKGGSYNSEDKTIIVYLPKDIEVNL